MTNRPPLRVRALLPAIHRRLTGGNLWNRRVLDELDRVAEVERRVVSPDGGPEPGPGAADVTLVDSLLLGAVDSLGAAAGRRVLVAHYLELLEPARRGTPAAAAERRRLGRLDAAVTTSAYCRDVLVGEGLAPDRVLAARPGLDPSYAAPPGPRPPGPPRLLTVSSVVPGKGLRRLLGLLEGLAGRDWTWTIAGETGLEPEFARAFRRRLEASPVADRVRLAGAVPPGDLVALYDRSHLFALPSDFETSSMATMEAMARGLPVVAYRAGGLVEHLPASSVGLLAPAGDLGALGESLGRVLADRALAARLGEANRRASRTFPSWEECGRRVAAFLRRLADGPA